MRKRIIILLIVLPLAVLVTLSMFSRRPVSLGVTDGRLAACPGTPNCVSTQADNQRHRIEPIPWQGSAAEAMQRIKQALAGEPRTQVVSKTDNYLHAEATSRVFRFVDDIEFYIDEAAELIHFRSASRVGRSDFGVNRARMQRLREAITRGA